MAGDRAYSQLTTNVVRLLGKRIQLGRKARKMTEAEMAERCGISRTTVRAIEAGNLKVEIGLVFEAAYVAGVVLFTDDIVELAANVQRVDDRLALLPMRARKTTEVRDDF